MGLALSVRPILSKFTENFYVRSRNNYEYHIHLALDLVLILKFYFALTCERCGDGHIGIETSGRVPWGENSSRIGLFRTRFITRVFQMWHFVKKKNCNASTIPSRAYINHIQKNFFPRTSLEGRPTWSKMVKIDQNRRGGGGGKTVPQVYVANYATAA